MSRVDVRVARLCMQGSLLGGARIVISLERESSRGYVVRPRSKMWGTWRERRAQW